MRNNDKIFEESLTASQEEGPVTKQTTVQNGGC